MFVLELFTINCTKREELYSCLLRTKNIIGSDAGLAGVGELAPRYSFGNHVQVDVLVNVNRTLATAFQSHWCQILFKLNILLFFTIAFDLS